MAVREILQLGDAHLWRVCAPVDPALASTQVLADDLRDTLASAQRKAGFGRALSAPQIGAPSRVLYVDMPSAFRGAMINPSIVWASAETFELWDDCFSFPDLLVRVRRASAIRVAYQDEGGGERSIEAQDGFSELLQHEIDHLDGILAVQRAVSPTGFCTRAQWLRDQARLAV